MEVKRKADKEAERKWKEEEKKKVDNERYQREVVKQKEEYERKQANKVVREKKEEEKQKKEWESMLRKLWGRMMTTMGPGANEVEGSGAGSKREQMEDNEDKDDSEIGSTGAQQGSSHP